MDSPGHRSHAASAGAGRPPAEASADAADTPAPPDPGPGLRVRRYLGAGSAGRVWLVEGPGGPAALKVGLRTAEEAATFEIRREANVLSRYRHENLLRIEGILDTDQGPALLLEYAAGGSAAAMVAARGSLPVGEAVTVLVGIAQALACLHGQGAAHGDVSPSNVLFDAEGRPLLADLGSVRLLGAGHAPAGTPGFEDPAAQDGPVLNLSSDVFALCAVGWYLLTGAPPPSERRRAPLPVLRPDVPVQLATALEAGLAEDPRQRPGADELARLIYTAAPPAPLDLVPGAHASELPILRTRHRRPSPEPRRRGLRRLRERLAGYGGVPHPWRRGRRWGRRPSAARPGGRVLLAVATGVAAATALLAVVAVAAPGLLGGPGHSSAPDAAQPRPAAATGAAGPGPGAPPAGEAPEAGPRNVGPDAGSAAAEAGMQGEGAAAGRAPEELPLEGAGPPTGGSSGVPDDPGGAVAELARLRMEALALADAAALGRVNEPDSPAMKADAAQVDRLLAAGRRLVPAGEPEVLATEVLQHDAGSALVRLELSLPGWEERDMAGAAVRAVEGPVTQRIVLQLVRGESGWLIREVLPDAP